MSYDSDEIVPKGFTILPTELLENIILYCDWRTRCCLQRSCKRFDALSKESRVWRSCVFDLSIRFSEHRFPSQEYDESVRVSVCWSAAHLDALSVSKPALWCLNSMLNSLLLHVAQLPLRSLKLQCSCLDSIYFQTVVKTFLENLCLSASGLRELCISLPKNANLHSITPALEQMIQLRSLHVERGSSCQLTDEISEPIAPEGWHSVGDQPGTLVGSLGKHLASDASRQMEHFTVRFWGAYELTCYPKHLRSIRWLSSSFLPYTLHHILALFSSKGLRTPESIAVEGSEFRLVKTDVVSETFPELRHVELQRCQVELNPDFKARVQQAGFCLDDAVNLIRELAAPNLETLRVINPDGFIFQYGGGPETVRNVRWASFFQALSFDRLDLYCQNLTHFELVDAKDFSEIFKVCLWGTVDWMMHVLRSAACLPNLKTFILRLAWLERCGVAVNYIEVGCLLSACTKLEHLHLEGLPPSSPDAGWMYDVLLNCEALRRCSMLFYVPGVDTRLFSIMVQKFNMHLTLNNGIFVLGLRGCSLDSVVPTLSSLPLGNHERISSYGLGVSRLSKDEYVFYIPPENHRMKFS